MISAACHQVIFFAMALNSTSCTFIIRSISELVYVRLDSNSQPHLPAPLFQSGQIMCELDRTNHILTTPPMELC